MQNKIIIVISEKMGSPGSILSKEWWKLCKYLYTGRDSDHSIPQLTTDNNIIFKDTDKAEAFNDYFNSISQVTDANAAIDESITSTDYELSNIIIPCQDAKDVLLNLKLNKAYGLDMINHRLFKRVSKYQIKTPRLYFQYIFDLGKIS